MGRNPEEGIRICLVNIEGNIFILIFVSTVVFVHINCDRERDNKTMI